jgi:hypothetical protein
MSLPGILQNITSPNTLIATSQAEILTTINTYAGAEIAANSEHIQESFQMLKVKALVDLGFTEESVSWYYYYDANTNTFQIVAGPSTLNALDQIQPPRAMLQLEVNPEGIIIGAGECYVTSLAFPPASPFSPTLY